MKQMLLFMEMSNIKTSYINYLGGDYKVQYLILFGMNTYNSQSQDGKGSHKVFSWPWGMRFGTPIRYHKCFLLSTMGLVASPKPNPNKIINVTCMYII